MRSASRFEGLDEEVPDDAALLLGIDHAGERVEEALARVDDRQRDAEALAEDPLDLLRLVLAQQAVVDQDAVQLVADRAVHERRGDRRIHAARKPADDAARRRLAPADLAHRFVR